jgi:hypothetical protein
MSKFVYTNQDISGILIYKKGVLVTPVPDKVVTTLEEALKGVIIEWEN